MTQESRQEVAATNATTGALLGAFAFASDLAFGLELEDSLRSCFVALRIAERMGLSEQQCAATYYASLLKDAGCTSWTTELASAWQTDEITARKEIFIFRDASDFRAFSGWMQQFIARDQPIPVRLFRYFRIFTTTSRLFADAFVTTALTACRIATRLNMPDDVQEAMLNMFEQWNGKGAPNGLRGEAIPQISRIVLPTFFIVPFHRVGGREAAVQLARHHRGGAFDPNVVDAFLELAGEEWFWRELESPDIFNYIQSLEPPSPVKPLREGSIDDLALAFADFIDLKSRFTAAHSRRVAAVAEQIAALAGCAKPAIDQIRRAALVHDLGLVGVPFYTHHRPRTGLSQSEQEQYRLHPYYAERILGRVALLSPLAEMVGTHEERMNGLGFYRGLAGTNISLGARIIGVADRLDELTHAGPEGPAVSVSAALEQLGREPVDQEIVAILRHYLGGRTAEAPLPKPSVPAGLSSREMEVLRLAARGLTRRDIARSLSISENTVRHHLEHIYNKTGSSNRVTATLYAMENGLLLD